MNKECIYIEGKAIIVDEKGYNKPIEYYENLEEVLVKENLIETMENKANELNKEKELLEKIKTSAFLDLIIGIMFIVIPYVLPNIFITLLTGSNPIINSILGSIRSGTLISILMGPVMNVMSIPFLINSYSSTKNRISKINGINSELTYLKNNIENEKQIIKQLKEKENKSNKIEEYQIIKVNDKVALKNLRDYLTLYYDCGYNIKKYYKYFEKDLLWKKLCDIYTVEQIERIEEYLEEKGPQLVKK